MNENNNKEGSYIGQVKRTMLIGVGILLAAGGAQTLFGKNVQAVETVDMVATAKTVDPQDCTNKWCYPGVYNSCPAELTGFTKYYGLNDGYEGQQTSFGEAYNPTDEQHVASWYWAPNTELRVCNVDNGLCTNVRVRDRGPNQFQSQPNKLLIADMSPSAFDNIAKLSEGMIKVRITRIGVCQR